MLQSNFAPAPIALSFNLNQMKDLENLTLHHTLQFMCNLFDAQLGNDPMGPRNTLRVILGENGSRVKILSAKLEK